MGRRLSEGRESNIRDHLTAIVPVKLDSPDRLANAEIVLGRLADLGITTLVLEQGGDSFSSLATGSVSHRQVPDASFFHRTKLVNGGARLATTAVVASWDVDVIVPEPQVDEAVRRIFDGEADIAFPFDYFLDVPRKHHPRLQAGNYDVDGELLVDSVGAVVCFGRENFLARGGYDEEFQSWGPEDVELVERHSRLGARVSRVGGFVYHLHHHRGPDSSTSNPFYQRNKERLAELRRSVDEEK